MTRLRDAALIAITAVSLTLAATTSGVTHAAVSALQTVFVVNTAKNPIPVQGTVATTGTTAIRGSVTISNTPSVTLAPAGNTVKIDPLSNTVGLDPQNNTVQVGNTAANPVPVASQDSAPTQPFQQEITATGSFTVPVNKRLVIEYISAVGGIGYYSDPPSNALGEVQVATVLNGVSASYTFGFPATSASSGPCCPSSPFGFGGTQQVRLYADGGSVVTISASSSPSGGAYATVSVSGYLVDTP